jgi:hypothetical protein
MLSFTIVVHYSRDPAVAAQLPDFSFGDVEVTRLRV